MSAAKFLWSAHRRSGHALLAAIWFLAFASVGLWFLLGGKSPDGNVRMEVRGDVQLVADRQTSSPEYCPIEKIEVGNRVLTPASVPGVALPTAVQRSTWKLLTLRAVNRWDDGTLDEMRIKTLQPAAWLSETGARWGSSVPIPLDLTEMGIPDQDADVVAIEPCPVIEEGPGRVVLTTVDHLNRFLFDLTVRGERGPPENIEVTGYHKLKSLRRGWVSVCELKEGEELEGHEGTLIVASLTRHEGTQRVYNMTVEGEHVYYVSGLDLLAHNLNCNQINKKIQRGQAPRGVVRADKGKIPGEQDHVHVNDGAINEDGSWKHAPASGLTRPQTTFLRENGVDVP